MWGGGTTRASLILVHFDRLLNCILHDEERADCTQASLNVRLQYYAKNIGNIQNDFKRVMEKIDHCKDDVGLLQQGQTNQEMFN